MKKVNQTLLQCMLAMMITSSGYSQLAQTELTLQPGACHGKDSRVQTINGSPAVANTNYGNYDQLVSAAWTFSGAVGYVRSLVNFTDLQLIPQGTVVSYAYLSLYGVPTSAAISLGSYGANACYVQRITSAWDESTVTWNNQPSTTTTNQVTLPGSNGVQWNYNVIDLNVTAMVQDLINLPPADRNGFFIRLQTESYYRSMLFASSDYADATKHPKLRIGLTFCSSLAAKKSANETSEIVSDVPGQSGKFQNGIAALVKTNLQAGNVKVDYELSKEGKTVLQIVSIDGAVLKTMNADGTKGKHTTTITLDSEVLKNRMAVLVVRQGNSVSSHPFVIAQ
ncbi:DNRLRE domain-containing protein [Niastella caeni]|uniref:DNRLRE domain-containing protein n=1 Tax=Niastella caeni TaxID=2569763 RepID=A0A4V4H0W3_9BACT|nr:DNRLRE domain-containing protein [Niastella caeni]THU38156.1 DNRLRE domain-containing protein [Niastella caeni]